MATDSYSPSPDPSSDHQLDSPTAFGTIVVVNNDLRRIYLDHAATTPLDPSVFDAMKPYMLEKYGNPSSPHSFGREARAAIDEARDIAASALGASAAEIYFTSGGTEADNLAILGGAQANRARGRHIITSAVEHRAVLEACAHLEPLGFSVTYLPVDRCGVVHPDDLRKALTPETILVSIMHANNEIGTFNPIAELAAIAREAGAIFHTDAVQSFGQVPIDVNALGVDMLSLSAHKIYGPKGVGALYVRSGIRFSPLFFGGAQERARRPGTENAAGIVGLGAAAKLALSVMDEASARIKELRDYFETELISRLTDSEQKPSDHSQPILLNGHPTARLPGISNIAFPGIECEMLLLNLDLEGVAASSGSACSAGAFEPSHVLAALGLPPEIVQASLRFSLGRGTTREEIDRVLDILPPIVARLRGR